MLLGLLLFQPLSADVLGEYVSFRRRRSAPQMQQCLEAGESIAMESWVVDVWTEIQAAGDAELFGVAGRLLAGSEAYGMEKIKETGGPRYRLKLSQGC
jgi:hypothetical protein